ncbi:MAG: DNA topoisomerase (ATP-hydrolyzing) subunit A [Spirochaetia bacterium]|nr:DNA topoisomerase (ATP-hydrolyzing) subunit A [Spirochaetia bacterium]
MDDDQIIENNERVIDVDVSKEMKLSYLNYAMSVIVSRALPDVRDGLKPVHRRILYDMYDMGLRSSGSYKKCARIVGDVLGKYHPHGDASVYDALVRLAQSFSLRYPVVAPQGNFGSIDGDPAAAMRYTESKMSKIGEEMLTDINKETVDFGPNYDDSMVEPTVLPAAFPFLLANGSSGIAVGMATNMAPHNINEICAAIEAVINDPDITIDELMKNYIKGPDFPTGANICGLNGIRDAFTTGRGKIVIRSSYEIEVPERGHDQIVFSEIPYQVNKAELVKKIDALRKDNIIPGIAAVKDESDRNGIRLVVELKTGAPAIVVLNLLFSKTALQTNFNVNNLALVNGRPQLLNLKQMLVYYIKHREDVVTRRTKYDLKKALERAHILKGLKIGLDNIDEVISIIKQSINNVVACDKLIQTFELDEIQAQAIIDMKLGRLSQLEAGKILEELADLEAKIEYYNSLLADEQKILAVVSQETKDLANRVGSKDKRLTIIHPEEIGQSNLEDFIKEEEVVVLISNKGFAKRIPVEEYKAQGRAGKGSRTTKLQDEDFVEHMFVASTHEYVMYVTDEGKAYYTKVFEIPEASKNAKGSSIKNLLQLSTAEKITTIFSFKEFDEDKYLMVATKLGVVKRCRLDLFKNARSKGVIAIILGEGDQLLHCEFVQDEDDVMLVTKNGLGLRMSALDVRAMGRATHGVRGIKLRDDDNVAGLLKVDPSKRILMVTEKGKGKQVAYDQFMNHHRGTLGQKIFRLTDKGSSIINAVSVNDENDIVCVTLQGQTIRIHVKDISTQGRNASGVKVVTMKSDDDSIVALASTYIDEEDSVDVEEQVVIEQENK